MSSSSTPEENTRGGALLEQLRMRMGMFALDVLPLTPFLPFCLDPSVRLPGPLLTLPTILNEKNMPQPMAPSIFQMQQFLQPKLALPVFPTFGLNKSRWLSEAPLRQRGLRMRPEVCDPNAFVMCNLCGNRILGNREINLRNHARRHATLKQFQCKYCPYRHSEITKVRLHMAHKHEDSRSRPIDNVNMEMRQAWKALLYDCFPSYFIQEGGKKPNQAK